MNTTTTDTVPSSDSAPQLSPGRGAPSSSHRCAGAPALSRFWDRAAPKYAAKKVADEAAYETTLERVAARLAGHHDVLEFGCGTGTTALRLAPLVRSILATDISSQMLSFAREKASASGVTNVQFVAASMQDADVSGRTFDVVMSFNLLHLLPDVPAAAAFAYRLVRPGGYFVSKTPCVGEAGFGLRLLIPMMRAFGRAPYVNFFRQDELKRMISGAGFDVVETGLYPVKTHSLFIVAHKPA